MTKSSLLIRYAALALALRSASALEAQEIVFLAFGDSITDGYGDTSALGGGYTRRLQNWLGSYGYDARVDSFGVGGETTAQGLSRIDGVLAGGGDYLLLMEGTNDISQHVGVETILFNLDTMASRAENLGISPVHASVIPRIPEAPVDGNNAKTFALAAGIRDLGETGFRPVADVFTVFEGLPDVFENYYYYDPEVEDPVGHPNTAGYIELGGVFLETLLPVLDGPQILIVPIDEDVPAGTLQSFQVVADESIERVEWNFGDGGIAIRELPDPFDLFYIFREAGSFTASVRGITATGAAGTDAESFVVTGPPLAWESRFVALPELQSASDGLVTTDLILSNESASFGLFEATFLPDIVYDAPPTPVRFMLNPGETLSSPEIVADAFGLPGGRGGLIVELIAAEGPAELSTVALVRAPADPAGASGCQTAEIPESSWTAAPQEISGIAPLNDESATIHVTNLDDAPGSVRLDLFDAVDGYVGSSVFALPAGGSRQRDLDDLFRGLAVLAEPLRASFVSSGVRFAAGLVFAGHGEQISCLVAAP